MKFIEKTLNYLMPRLVNHSVETNKGEVTVNINLTLEIKMDQKGEVLSVKQQQKTEESFIDIEDVNEKELINFGKNI